MLYYDDGWMWHRPLRTSLTAHDASQLWMLWTGMDWLDLLDKCIQDRKSVLVKITSILYGENMTLYCTVLA
jgi:hypothetical protein